MNQIREAGDGGAMKLWCNGAWYVCRLNALWAYVEEMMEEMSVRQWMSKKPSDFWESIHSRIHTVSCKQHPFMHRQKKSVNAQQFNHNIESFRLILVI